MLGDGEWQYEVIADANLGNTATATSLLGPWSSENYVATVAKTTL